MIKTGISLEQAKKKAESLPDGGAEKAQHRQQWPEGGPEVAQQTMCKRCCRFRGKRGCPSKRKQCNICQETGHYAKSILYPKKNLTTKKLDTSAV